MTFLLKVVFAVLGAALARASLFWLIALARHRDLGQRRALTGALGAMFLQVGLWAVLVPGLGILACRTFYPPMLERADLAFAGVMAAFVWNLLLALVVVVLITVGRRLLWVRSTKPTDLASAGTISRLLVNWWILGAVIGVSWVGAALFLYRWLAGRPLQDFVFPLAAPLAFWIAVAFGALGSLPLVGSFFREGPRATLYVLMDILSHFYERRLKVPWPVGRPKVMHLGAFVFQMRIEARLRRVLQEVLYRMENSRVTDLTLASHSQGTVIALDTLWLNRTHRLLEGQPDRQVRQVTMGSPFTHLYQYFYPARYPPLFDGTGKLNPAWVPLENGTLEWDQALDRPVQEWVNIYRVDDFIGTDIDGRGGLTGAFPVNTFVGRGGHTNYWKEAEVLDLLRPLLPGG
jgi:hypothetical protein